MTVKNAADILVHLHQGQVDLGVKRVETHDPQVAQAILDRLFSFEDLLFLSALDMQTLLLKISDKTLVVCLKNVSKPLGIKILGAMTKARARSIGEDLQNSEKLRVSEIEAVQLEVLKVAYELHQTQNITLRKSAVDEQYIWLLSLAITQYDWLNPNQKCPALNELLMNACFLHSQCMRFALSNFLCRLFDLMIV